MRYISDVDGRRGPCCRRWSTRSRRSRRRGRLSARYDGLDDRAAQRANPLCQAREALCAERVVTAWQDLFGARALKTHSAYACMRILGHDTDLAAILVCSRIGRRRIPRRRGSRRRGAQSRRSTRSFMSARRSAQSAKHLRAPCSTNARRRYCRPGCVRSCVAHRGASSISAQIKASVGMGATRALALQRTLGFESRCLCSCQSCLLFKLRYASLSGDRSRRIASPMNRLTRASITPVTRTITAVAGTIPLTLTPAAPCGGRCLPRHRRRRDCRTARTAPQLRKLTGWRTLNSS